MDYVVFSSLRGTSIADVLISYDISCQWSKKLVERHTYLPHDIRLDFRHTKLDYAIPKFHLPSHKTSCHTAFSLNLCPGVGQTDGEEIERRWAFANEAAPSMREMGEGSRHDTLDDVWGASNYHNALGLRVLLEDRYEAAAEEYATQMDQFKSLSRDLSVDDMENWERLVRAWEADRTQPDPYVVETATAIPYGPEITATSFLIYAFEIEETQRRFTQDKVGFENALSTTTKDNRTSSSPATIYLAKLVERQHILLNRIANFRELQAHFMPHVAALIPRSPDNDVPDSITLYLPSQLSLPHFRSADEDELSRMECELCYAQATDSLIKLWHAICAYLQLDGQASLPELLPEDIRPIYAHQDGPAAASEGKRQLSWIWHVSGSDPQNPDMHEALRIEWLKCRARKDQWGEEVQLLKEEMRPEVTGSAKEGVEAYTHRQASISTKRAVQLEYYWNSYLCRPVPPPHLPGMMSNPRHELAM